MLSSQSSPSPSLHCLVISASDPWSVRRVCEPFGTRAACRFQPLKGASGRGPRVIGRWIDTYARRLANNDSVNQLSMWGGGKYVAHQQFPPPPHHGIVANRRSGADDEAVAIHSSSRSLLSFGCCWKRWGVTRRLWAGRNIYIFLGIIGMEGMGMPCCLSHWTGKWIGLVQS